LANEYSSSWTINNGKPTDITLVQSMTRTAHLLGRPETGIYSFERTYTVPKHTLITFSMYLYARQKVSGDICTFYFDSLQITSPYYDYNTNGGENIGPLLWKGSVRHQGDANSKLKIRIVRSAPMDNSWFGFREFFLHFHDDSTSQVKVLDKMCQIPIAKTTTVSNQCECEIDQGLDLANKCVKCAPGCDFCLGSLPNQCLIPLQEAGMVQVVDVWVTLMFMMMGLVSQNANFHFYLKFKQIVRSAVVILAVDSSIWMDHAKKDVHFLFKLNLILTKE